MVIFETLWKNFFYRFHRPNHRLICVWLWYRWLTWFSYWISSIACPSTWSASWAISRRTIASWRASLSASSLRSALTWRQPTSEKRKKVPITLFENHYKKSRIFQHLLYICKFCFLFTFVVPTSAVCLHFCYRFQLFVYIYCRTADCLHFCYHCQLFVYIYCRKISHLFIIILRWSADCLHFYHCQLFVYIFVTVFSCLFTFIVEISAVCLQLSYDDQLIVYIFSYLFIFMI